MRRVWASSFLLAGLAALVGCATSRTAQCTSKGGEPWYEIESPHFRLRSNADFEHALRTASMLEKYRRALLLVWREQFDPPGQLDVIGLRNRDQLSEFVSPQVAAYLTLLPGGWQAVMALDYPLESPSDVQLHELAHYLSHHVLLRQPKWLSEGLATYLQTATVSDSPAEVILGLPHRASLEEIRQHGWLSLQQLWTWSANVSGASRNALYASSWLWFHYLTDEHQVRFADFQNRLSSAEDPLSAWASAFNGVSSDLLERGVREYLDQRRLLIRSIAATLETPRVVFHRMDDAEIHATRARLYLTARTALSAGDRRRLILGEVAEALEHDPRNESARVLQAELASTRRERLAIAQQLVNSSPDSSTSWSLFVRSLDQDEDPGPDVERLLVRAASASMNDPAVLSGLASYYLKRGAAEKGLYPAFRAVRLAPWQARSLATYAAILAAVGHCDSAVSAQKRAMGLLGEYASEELRLQYQKRLAEYAQRCPSELR